MCSALCESNPSCSSRLQIWKLKTITWYAAAAVGHLLNEAAASCAESAASCFESAASCFESARCCIIYCSCILCCCCYLFASSDAQLQARTLNLREHITEKRTVLSPSCCCCRSLAAAVTRCCTRTFHVACTAAVTDALLWRAYALVQTALETRRVIRHKTAGAGGKVSFYAT